MNYSILLYLAAFTSLSLFFLYKEEEAKRRSFGQLFVLLLAGFSLNDLLFAQEVSILTYSGKLLLLFIGTLALNIFSEQKAVFLTFLFSILGISLYWNSSIEPKEQLDEKGELLVEIKEGHNISELEDLLDAEGLTARRAFDPKHKDATDLDDYFVVDIPEGIRKSDREIVMLLEQEKAVEYIEFNEIITLEEPSKVQSTGSSRLKSWNDPEISKLWGFQAMEVDKLYSFLKKQRPIKRKRVKIAILDTGIDAKHEDLRGSYFSIKKAYDTDENSHGTHCAGIAAAVSNNTLGIASFFPNNKDVLVASVKVFGRFGRTSQERIIKGMLEAADAGVDVISMSLGGPSSDAAQKAYARAVEYANQRGAIVVVAAGNENTDARKRVPASVKGVITVAALDENLQRASFSNSVSKLEMGIAAPGTNIYSTVPGNEYAAYNGTSMATPYVAGLLGLIKVYKPNLTTKEAYQILTVTAIKIDKSQEIGDLICPHTAIKSVVN